MNDNGNHTIQVKETPKKQANGSYIQVPSSSPINIRSSPHGENSLKPPSMTQMNTGGKPISSEKEQELERKRQSIRNHANFPPLRKKFYYLSESDIFKGFIKGKSNLRDASQWLTENFDKRAIVAKLESKLAAEAAEKKQQEELSTKEKLARLADREEQQRQQQKQEEENQKQQHHDNHYDDEDVSPVKVRGKARSKSQRSGSPQAGGSVQRLSSLQDKSTRVQLGKPKMSILEKYKHKPKSQSLIDQAFTKQPNDQGGDDEEQTPKRRRLVRGSGSTGSTEDDTPAPATDPAQLRKNLAAKYQFTDPQLPQFNYQKADIAPKDDDDMIVSDDDLDKIEEKIKENKRRAKAKSSAQEVVRISDDDDDNLDDEDEESDGMSDEEDDDDGYNSRLTSNDSQILDFLNNAPVHDIIEISNVPPKVANAVIAERPFKTIYQISEHHFETEETPEAAATDTKQKRRRTPKKPLGLKIIENTEFSLKGYKAVDSLVKKCSQYGSLISDQMAKWGVNVTGEGELEMVDLNPEAIEASDKAAEDRGKDEDEDDEDDVVVVKHNKSRLRYIHENPSMLDSDVVLKNYQLVGINWLNLLYQNKLSCILADEMGLGKTCQVIAFMAHLKETQTKSRGPHLVIVPSSTLENWLREFNKFCPEFVVQAYYGSQREREELRYDLQDVEFDVMVTTYNLATGAAPDFKFLKNRNFDMIVYDEGHMLKNSNSERYNKLMRLKARFRLLLTGTPLQNNLKELVSLLAFMLPDLFNEKREDLQGLFSQKVSIADKNPDDSYNPLLSIQAITKAKTMMTPFVLRRKKVQVLKHLPAKTHEIIRCGLTDSQRKIYTKYLDSGKATKLERERRKQLVGKEAEEARKTSIPSSSNVMMSLRKASMHPLLFRLIYTDKIIAQMAKEIMEEPEYVDANQNFIREDMSVMSDYELHLLCEKFPKTLGKRTLKKPEFLNSGKITKLIEVLNAVIEKKEKVLVFSLFTQMLDILEKILSLHDIKFLRLDGSTSVDTRQDLIDTFYTDDTIPVFLLSTKAGGFGINLVAANNVIMYDQSFNPHDDKQAEDRAHRVGQTKEVRVVKLITENTIEENMLQLAENKLQLDQSISGGDMDSSKIEEKAVSMFEKILFES